MPGTATSSLADGGVAVGGEISEVMKANSTTNPTINIATEQTHRETSPYALQNVLGRAIQSRKRCPRWVRTIRTIPRARVAFQRSSVPFLSHVLMRTYQPMRRANTRVQLA